MLMKPAWMLVVLGACTSDDLPSEVASSRRLATQMDITTVAAPVPMTKFVVGVGTVGPDSKRVDDATVTVFPERAARIDLAFARYSYEAEHTGYAAGYYVDIRRGRDYLSVDIDAPPPIMVSAEPRGIGLPLTLRWDDADPTLYFTVEVTHGDERVPISGQYLGANVDHGTYELPGLVFDQPGAYTISVQRTRRIHWADSFECEHDCAVLSSVRANTIASTTFTL